MKGKREMYYLKKLTKEKKTNYNSNMAPASQYIFLLLVCPSCGTEIVGKWSYVQELLSKSDECNASVMEKIAGEIESFLLPKNFLCPCCGHALCRDPGYFLFEDHGDGRKGGYIKGYGQNLKSFAPLYNLYVNNILSFTNDIDAKMFALEGYPNSDLYPFDHGMFIYKYNSIAEDFYKFSEYKDPPTQVMKNGIKRHSFKDIRLGGPKLNNDSYRERQLTIEDAFSLLKYYRKRLTKIQRMNDIIKGNYGDSEIIQDKFISLDNNVEGIKQYLYYLIQLETTIIALSKRLPALYKIQVEMSEKEEQRRLLQEKESHARLNKEKEKEEKLKKELNQAENNFIKMQTTEDLWKEYYDKIYAAKANSILQNYGEAPKKPTEPELKIAGLFNKKKVMIENERRQAVYTEDLSQWKKAMSVWQIGLDQKNSIAAEEAEKEAKQKAEQSLKDAEQTIEKKKKELQIVEQTLQEESREQNEVVSDNIWDADVRQAEELLKKCVQAKVQYENTNIVFAKYRDIVAYSSFYEYLDSGRCDSLSGRDGAYNLYESEIRQNMVISKLSDVVDSLDDIKQNQFVIYKQLSSMNNSLNKLNDSMNDAVSSLHSINSNTAQTAYNTEVTAYYAKKNAELTDALGYLVALK